MATSHAKQPLRIHRQLGKEGVVWNTDPGEEASQDYKKGTPLVRDGTSAELEEWAAGTDATKIVGIAASDATGTAGKDVAYYEANPTNEFEGTLVDGTSNHTLAAANIGTDYSLVEASSGGNWYVDKSDETTKKAQVLRPAPGSAIGDTNARVVFRFSADMQANLQDA